MKTFKNSYMSAESSMEIEPSISGELFHITHVTGHGEKSFKFSNTDAPALALAILEAAGVEARHHSAYENGTPEAMEHIAQALTDEIGIAEAATTEAKEQAELEAEALELRNAYVSTDEVKAWNELFPSAKQQWLAVARRAREMGAEN